MLSEVDEINPVTQGMHLLETAFTLTGKINTASDEMKEKQKRKHGSPLFFFFNK